MKRYCYLPGFRFAFLLSFFIAATASAQWTTVGGNVSFNEAYAQNYSFAIDSTGVLYAAFADMGNQYIVTVKKRESGGTWVNVGTPGFITGSGAASSLFYNPGTSIAVNPADSSLYIALADGDHDNKISVMRFNGTAWVYVGTPGFSLPSACGVKLAFTNAGIPYVAFSTCYTGGEISVMFFNGAWQYAGSPGFATGNYVQLAVAPDNKVSVAFRDAGNSNKISVMSLTGSVWSYTGAPGFSDGEVEHLSMTADAAGKLYVAYSDYSNNGKITVKDLTGGTWATAGNPAFSNFSAGNIDISINRFGVPYVSFTDNIFPVAKKLHNGVWVSVGNNIINAAAYHTSIVNDSLGNPFVLLALKPFITLPFVYTYSPCNDTTYHFMATAVLDSALSVEGDSTTIQVTASGGVAPYTGTGSFIITSGGDYTYTVTDRNGCSRTTTVSVPYPPCIENYWTGYNSADWTDAANWSCGTVPGAVTVVHVATGAGFYPVISSVVTCKEVIVATGATITVATGGELKILKQ